jgi:hypothetical protein
MGTGVDRSHCRSESDNTLRARNQSGGNERRANHRRGRCRRWTRGLSDTRSERVWPASLRGVACGAGTMHTIVPSAIASAVTSIQSAGNFHGNDVGEPGGGFIPFRVDAEAHFTGNPQLCRVWPRVPLHRKPLANWPTDASGMRCQLSPAADIASDGLW